LVLVEQVVHRVRQTMVLVVGIQYSALLLQMVVVAVVGVMQV